MSPLFAMDAELRACRSAAQAAAKLLTVLDRHNHRCTTVGSFVCMMPSGRALRGCPPATESAMCELRAALAGVKP